MKMVKFFFLLFFLVHVVDACEVTDDTGYILHLKQPAQRIVSLAPDLTEILFSINAGTKVVGLMRGSDYPKETQSIPIVANYNRLNIEALLALHPDLIVTWADVPFLQQLKKLKFPVYISHPEKITDIPETMRRLGCLSGNEKKAGEEAQLFLQRYQALKKQYENKKKLTVFYQVWSKPLLTVTKQSWINEIMTLCGGKNIFADLRGVAPLVNSESVMVANPDVILGSHTENWHEFSRLSAVNNKHLFSLDTDLIERAGPRMIMGAEKVCNVLDGVRNEVIGK